MSNKKTENSVQEVLAFPRNKVTIKFYPKASAMVTDPSHKLFGGLGPNATISFQLPRTTRGSWKNPFPSDEMRYMIEENLGMAKNTLLTTNRGVSWFDDYFISLSKSDKSLDLSDPSQYLDYLIIKTLVDHVAPEVEAISDRATYMWYIEDSSVVNKRARLTVSKRSQAYKELGKIEDSPAKLRQIIIEDRGKSNLPASSNDPDWLIGQIDDMINERPERFLAIALDPNLSIKIDVYDAVKAGVIKQKGRLFYNELDEAITMPGHQNDIHGAIAFLNAPENSDYYAVMKQRIQNSN